jgi:hypothetical protein
MMRRFFTLIVCLMVSLPLAGGATAQATVHSAGIYVDFGNGDTAMVLVPFTGDEISGTELLMQSGLPVLTIGFGGFGDAVCMIETTGCDVSACRRTLCQNGDRQSPFWQYMKQSESGEWVFSPLGASANKVTDGDLNAWVWTGNTPQLPEMTLADLRSKTGELQDGKPAIFTTYEDRADDTSGNLQLLIGGGMIGLTIIAGAALLVMQKRRHVA